MNLRAFPAVVGMVVALGCAPAKKVNPPDAGPREAQEGREFTDRLRVDTTYRPLPQGGECVSCFYELPRGSYIAQGWWYDALWFGSKPCRLSYSYPVSYGEACRKRPSWYSRSYYACRR